MPWKTPDFKEINLSGEVTAYVNSDDQVRPFEQQLPMIEASAQESAAELVAARGDARREFAA